MRLAKILYTFIGIFFISPASAIDMHKSSYADLDDLGFMQPVYKQVHHNNIFEDQITVGIYADPDNFPFSSKKQGSIFYELFTEFFNDRHLYIEILYPEGNYQEEISNFENNLTDWNGVFGMYFGSSKYSKNKYLYPAFAENGIHLITSKDKKIDVQNKEELKKYKGVYSKDDKLEQSVIRDFKRLGIKEVETLDYAIEDLLTGKIDFIVASYYRSQIKLYKQGLMNYVNYSLNPVWKIPLFIKVNPAIVNSENIEYIKQYIQSSYFKQKRDELLAKLLDTYKENTKGVIPPTYVNTLQTEVEEKQILEK